MTLARTCAALACAALVWRVVPAAQSGGGLFDLLQVLDRRPAFDALALTFAGPVQRTDMPTGGKLRPQQAQTDYSVLG